MTDDEKQVDPDEQESDAVPSDEDVELAAKEYTGRKQDFPEVPFTMRRKPRMAMPPAPDR